MELTFSSIVTDILIFTTVVVLYFYFRCKYTFQYWQKKGVPHLQPSFPFGNFDWKIGTRGGQTIKDIYIALKKTGARYGGYYMLGIPFFLPLDPDLCKDMLTTHFQHFEDRGMYYDEERDPMSAHLVSLPGRKWKNLRTKLTPAFSPAKIKTMFSVVSACSIDLSNVLQGKLESDSVDMYDVVSRYTSDTICSCAFGIKSNSLKNPNAEFRKYGQMLAKLNIFDSIRMTFGVFVPNILKIFRVAFFNPNVTNFFYNIAKETVEYREKNKCKRNDIMQLLIRLKHNENIDDDSEGNVQLDNRVEAFTFNQLASQVFLFFLGGFESSASTLSFTLVELAHNETIQDEVRKELLRVWKKYDGQLTYDAVMEMKYMDRVLYETMRKYPPFSLLNRICTKTYKVPNSDLIIEKGVRVVVSILAMHYDPEYFPDPEKFDPDRFSEKENAKRHPFTYLPFGDGPRVCLGIRLAMIQVKIGLIHILKDFKYSPDPRTKLPATIVSNGNMLVPKSKLWLKMKKI